jgi:hypothetical protein
MNGHSLSDQTTHVLCRAAETMEGMRRAVSCADAVLAVYLSDLTHLGSKMRFARDEG